MLILYMQSLLDSSASFYGGFGLVVIDVIFKVVL